LRILLRNEQRIRHRGERRRRTVVIDEREGATRQRQVRRQEARNEAAERAESPARPSRPWKSLALRHGIAASESPEIARAARGIAPLNTRWTGGASRGIGRAKPEGANP
jgi:hypothetical protein